MKLHPIRPKPATISTPLQSRGIQSRDPEQSRDRKGAGTTPKAPIATKGERHQPPPNPVHH